MILLSEIRDVAKRTGLFDSLVEKDYALGWLIKGITQAEEFKDSLILKGGTALRKFYFPQYRFSEDLDFTSKELFEDEKFRATIEKIVEKSREESGIDFRLAELKKTLDDERGKAWEVKVSFVGPRNARGSLSRIKVDVTTYEKILFPLQKRPIFHPYSDRFECIVDVYSLEEIASEKLRTILQRAYPRDIFDAWYILSQNEYKVDTRVITVLFEEKCRSKKVEWKDIEDFKGKILRSNLKIHWDSSLKKFLPRGLPVDKIQNELIEMISEMLYLQT